MVNPIDEPEEEIKEEKSEIEQTFESMPEFVPPRDSDIGEGMEGEVDGHETLEERIEGSPKLSDVQAVIRMLVPDLSKVLSVDGSKVKWINTLQMARILPDYYTPFKRMVAKHLIRSLHISGAEAMAIAEVSVGTAIDGEVRLDIIHVAGRGALAEEAKEKNAMGSIG